MSRAASADLSPLAARLASERLLLTGATGFLGKVVLEKLLRSTPGGEPVHVLIRPRRGDTPEERLRTEVLGASLFDRLALEAGGRDALARRVVAVPGDVGEERLGLSEGAYRALADRVTAVINCSANCSFHEPLDVALEVNALGALRVLRFAADAGDVPLVHVSSAYVCGDRKDDVEEAVLPPGHTVRSWMEGGPATWDASAAVPAMLEEAARIRREVGVGEGDGERARHLLVELGRRSSQEGGWGNVYLFSKAVGEQLVVRERGRVPLAIVRPSLIESTLAEPIPGWTDTMRISALMIECGRGTLEAFAGRDDLVLDFVPCDLVANAVLAALPSAAAGRNAAGGGGGASARPVPVYHVGTSHRNPLTLGEGSRIGHAAFSKRPIHGLDGAPLEPSYVRWVPRETFDAEVERHAKRLARLRERLSAQGEARKAREVAILSRRLAWLQEFAATYAQFADEQPRFLDDNTRALMASLTDADREAFPFDTAAFDWEAYLSECQLPGLMRLQGIHPWKVAPIRERMQSGAGAAVADVLREAAEIYGDRIAVQAPAEAPGRWTRTSFRELSERPEVAEELLRVSVGTRLPGLREALANGDASPRGGLLCVSRNGAPRPPATELLAALATGACLTLVD